VVSAPDPAEIQQIDEQLRMTGPDGIYVTGPDVQIDVTGFESQALRAEGYITMWKKRVLSGLATSAQCLGEEEVGDIASDALTVVMHDQTGAFQRTIARHLNDEVFFWWLIEGGFDPINEEDPAYFQYLPIAIDEAIKKKDEATQEWLVGGLTEDEYREELGREPLTDADRESTFPNLYKDSNTDAAAGVANTKDNRLRPAGKAGKKSSPSGQISKPAKKKEDDDADLDL
jgi:hypothetical protein